MLRSQLFSITALLVVIPCVVSCGTTKVPAKLKVERVEPTEISNAARVENRAKAISEIHTKFNLTSNEAFDAVISELEERNIRIAGADEPSGVINTKWLPIEDHMCEGGTKSFAPLACRVKFSFAIAPLSESASSLVSRYHELCNFNEDVRVECPNSNAENLLRQIVDEVITRN